MVKHLYCVYDDEMSLSSDIMCCSPVEAERAFKKSCMGLPSNIYKDKVSLFELGTFDFEKMVFSLYEKPRLIHVNDDDFYASLL